MRGETLVRLVVVLLLALASHGLRAQGTVTEYGIYSPDRKLLRQRHGNGKRDGVEHWQRNHLGHGIRNG